MNLFIEFALSQYNICAMLNMRPSLSGLSGLSRQPHGYRQVPWLAWNITVTVKLLVRLEVVYYIYKKIQQVMKVYRFYAPVLRNCTVAVEQLCCPCGQTGIFSAGPPPAETCGSGLPPV
jgi:hypothetical protein